MGTPMTMTQEEYGKRFLDVWQYAGRVFADPGGKTVDVALVQALIEMTAMAALFFSKNPVSSSEEMDNISDKIHMALADSFEKEKMRILTRRAMNG